MLFIWGNCLCRDLGDRLVDGLGLPDLGSEMRRIADGMKVLADFGGLVAVKEDGTGNGGKST